MKNRVLNGLIVLIVVMIMAGCGKKEPAGPAAEAGTAKAMLADTVVVSMNGHEIKQKDVDRELENILAQYQGRVPPQQLLQLQTQFREQAVESLINKQVLSAEADKQNIQVTDNETETELKRISSQFESPEKFKQQLDMMGMTEEKVREDIRQNYRIEKLLKSHLPEITVSDEDTEKFYRENTDSFTTPEQIQASHILLAIADNATDEVKKQKREELTAVLGQIRGGADFAELAKKHSDCPSKEQGGSLGSFARGSMVKPFEDAAFAMKKDEVSDIVETQFGLHLIKLTGRTEAQVAPLAQVKDRISEYLKSQKQNEAVGAYLETLRKAANIEYAEEVKKK